MILSNMLSMAGGGSSSEGKTKGTLTITLPKTDYLYGEHFSLTGAVITYTPKRGDPVNVTEQVINSNGITPADNTVWDVAGDQTVRAVYVNSDGDEIYGKVVVKVAEAGKGYLTVTTSKSRYNHGDQFNTSVLTIKYTNPAGVVTTIDPSSVYITTVPENGSNFEIDGQNTIIVSYDYASESGDQTANNPAPGYVKITVGAVASTMQLKLKNTGSLVGGLALYEGSNITITYSDGSQKHIIYGQDSTEDAKITWDPHERTTLDDPGETEVTATYTENGYSISASSYIKVTNAKLKAITFSIGKTSFKAGDAINYDECGVSVVASYDDGSTRVVTNYATFTPNRGSWQVGDTQVTATYEENGQSISESKPITVADAPESLSVSISKTSYTVGEAITYSGSQCIVRYASGREEEVSPGAIGWSPSSGTICSSEGSVFVTATFNGLTARTSVSVREKTTTGTDSNGNATSTSVKDLNDPSKTTTTIIPTSVEPEVNGKGYSTSVYEYSDGDTIDFQGLSLKLLDKNGDLYSNPDIEEPYKNGHANYKKSLDGTEFVFPSKIARVANATGYQQSGIPPIDEWKADITGIVTSSAYYFRCMRSGGYWYGGHKVVSPEGPMKIALFRRKDGDPNANYGYGRGDNLIILFASKTKIGHGMWGNGFNPSRSEGSDDQLRQLTINSQNGYDVSHFTYADRTVYFKVTSARVQPSTDDFNPNFETGPITGTINSYRENVEGESPVNNDGNRAGLYAWKLVYGYADGDTSDLQYNLNVPVEWNKFGKKYTTSIKVLVKAGKDGIGIMSYSGTSQSAYFQALSALQNDPNVEIVSTDSATTSSGTVYTIRYRMKK